MPSRSQMQPRSVDGALGHDDQGNTFIIRNGVPVKAARGADGNWAPDIGVKDSTAPGASLWAAPPSSAPDPIARRAEYQTQQKAIADQRAALGGYQPLSQELDQWDQLNAKQGTGGLQLGLPAWTGAPGAAKMLSPDLQAMDGISSKLQLASVPKGQGQISDFERTLFAQGVPVVGHNGGVNANTTAYMRSKLQEEADRLDFAEHYLSSNGTSAGSQRAWQAYTQANPYIKNVQPNPGGDAGSYPATGKVVPNPNRMPWQQFFGLQPPPQAQRQPQARAAPRMAPRAAAAPAGGQWAGWSMQPSMRH